MIKKIIIFIRYLVERFKFYFSKLKVDVNISEKKAVLAFIFAFIFSIMYLYFISAPSGFPVGKIFSVSQGESLENVTQNLYSLGAIRYPSVFRAHVIVMGGEKRVIAGDYLLDKKESPADLAYRLVNGKFNLNLKKLTIPEGWNIFEIGSYLDETLENFDKKKFLELAKNKEGYLFPDTYFVSPATKPGDLIDRMGKNFNKKVQDIPGLATTTIKFSDVIIMASIIEREANTPESRRAVSSILWKRIKNFMPLQVDSAFDYVNGKNTFTLTLSDLKIDSPYNTYKYKGLPPGPIGNPGADSISAAINPTETDYLYFLTGRNGKMYYAKTFEEHVKNKQKYLW